MSNPIDLPGFPPLIQRVRAWGPPFRDFLARQGPMLFLLALALGPIFAVDLPAMLDYPNHLARMYVLSRDGTAAANPFYQVTWTLNTNLVMDLVVPPLARFIGVEAAAKTFYFVSQLLLISGALLLERVVKGRVQLAPLAAAMFLYSVPFAWGFVNFEFGLGVALWAIVVWLATEGRPWLARALVHSIFVMVLFAAHLFALGVYGFTVGMHELWRARSGRASLKETAISLAMLAAPAATLLAATLYSRRLDWWGRHRMAPQKQALLALPGDEWIYKTAFECGDEFHPVCLFPSGAARSSEVRAKRRVGWDRLRAPLPGNSIQAV